MRRFMLKAVLSSAVALAVVAVAPAASAQQKDWVHIGSTGVAKPLDNPEDVYLWGEVKAVCMADSRALGGYAGQVTESTSKGNPGGGECTSDFQVVGSVQIGTDGPKVQCTPKIVQRPEDGWNDGMHYAHYGAVRVSGTNVTCAMGGE